MCSAPAHLVPISSSPPWPASVLTAAPRSLAKLPGDSVRTAPSQESLTDSLVSLLIHPSRQLSVCLFFCLPVAHSLFALTVTKVLFTKPKCLKSVENQICLKFGCYSGCFTPRPVPYDSDIYIIYLLTAGHVPVQRCMRVLHFRIGQPLNLQPSSDYLQSLHTHDTPTYFNIFTYVAWPCLKTLGVLKCFKEILTFNSFHMVSRNSTPQRQPMSCTLPYI